MPLKNSSGIFFLNLFKMKTRTLFLFNFLFISSIVFSQTVGPEKGKLMIVGGGSANPLIEKFVEIAGGKDAQIVVIPTAGTQEEFNEDWYFRKTIEEGV